jgi:hypothetical protein
MNTNLSPTQLAWEILGEAEEAFEALSNTQESAENAGLPQPESIPEYLWWIEREASLQESLLDNDPENYDRVYAQALRDLAAELSSLGFSTAARELVRS